MNKNKMLITLLLGISLGALTSCNNNSINDITPVEKEGSWAVEASTLIEDIPVREEKKSIKEEEDISVVKILPTVEAITPTTQILSKWIFSKVEVDTSGIVEFIQTGDETTIRLSQFNTSPAPDLGIYLSKQPSISSSSDISSAIKLTQLKNSSGDQTYLVPPNIDLSQYNSIAIHCTSYNKLFWSASLK